MPASTVRCHVLDGEVTVVTDLAGNVTNVVCPQFSRMTHGCLKKNRELGIWKIMLAKGMDRATGTTRAAYCEFGNPDESPMTEIVRSRT